MGFSENLRQLRKQAGYTQAAFAEKLGVSRQTVVQWERPDGDKPDFINLLGIVTVLGCSWNKLMNGEVETIKDYVPDWSKQKSLVACIKGIREKIAYVSEKYDIE